MKYPSLLSAAVLLCTASAFAQAPPPPLMMKQLKPDVWAGLGGSGGNSTIYVGKTGDIVVTNRADDNPNIHMDKNGSVEGWMANVKGMIGLNADQYVTGHGDVVTKADLQRKLAAVTDRRNKIAAMVKQGKSLEDVK